MPDSVVWCDQAQGVLAWLGTVSSSASSADPHRVARPAVTDVAGAAARLAEVHERLAAAQGNITAAQSAFQRGLAEIERLPLSYERALLELAYGQVLRRAGQRRAAASQLQAARERLSTLNARPDLERCDRELAACGLAPAKRSEFDPRRLTPQESAVAGLVATGVSNREVATELFVSIKTVQFHLTHIYAKLGINSRCELAAQFRDQDTSNTGNEQRSTFGQPSSSRVKYPQGTPRRDRARPAQQLRRATPFPLTPQESAVAGLVATGMSNREVATELFVSIKTVQFHLTHIYAKLGINSRCELAAQFCDQDTSNTGNEHRSPLAKPDRPTGYAPRRTEPLHRPRQPTPGGRAATPNWHP
jgi:DNA-binding NarL/FixJ family response regulator